MRAVEGLTCRLVRDTVSDIARDVTPFGGGSNGNRHWKAGDPIVAFHEGKIPVIIDALDEGRPISRIALARLTRWTNSMTALELS
jgi:hypothetical protein